MQKENTLHYSMLGETLTETSQSNKKNTPLITVYKRTTIKDKMKYIAGIMAIGLLSSGIQFANASPKAPPSTYQSSKSNDKDDSKKRNKFLNSGVEDEGNYSQNTKISSHDAEILIRYGFMEPAKSSGKLKKLYKDDKVLSKGDQVQKQAVIAEQIAKHYDVNPDTAQRMVREAYIVGGKHGLKPELLLGIAAVESGFNPKARNKSGAIGLMQALPRAHRDKISAVKKRGGSMYNIRDNLEVGAQIYSELLDRYKGNTTLALQAYNGAVKDRKKVYSKKVYKAVSNIKAPDVKLAYNH